MNFMGSWARSMAAAAVIVATAGAGAPALAAPADVALLQSYIGSWSGRGVFNAKKPETVVCKLTLSKGNGDKVNYSGRCAVAGTNLSINGTLAYVDANKRFEAAMTSNAKFSGTAIGKKSGNGVVFNLKEAGENDKGEKMNLAAQIALNGGTITVNFNVQDNASGQTYAASIPFKR